MFRPNPLLARQVADQDANKAALKSAASNVAAAVRAIAPDGGPYRGYRETIRVTQDDTGTRVETTDPFGHLVEWGSINNPPYAPLRRGVRAAGLRLDETPKT